MCRLEKHSSKRETFVSEQIHWISSGVLPTKRRGALWRCKPEAPLIREAHILHHKARRCESTGQDQGRSQRPAASFDPPTSEAPLKSPNPSRLLPAQLLRQRPWDAECTLSASVDSEERSERGQRAKDRLRIDNPCTSAATRVSSAGRCFLLGSVVLH